VRGGTGDPLAAVAIVEDADGSPAVKTPDSVYDDIRLNPTCALSHSSVKPSSIETLPMGNLTIFDLPSGVSDSKRAEAMNRLGCPFKGGANGLVATCLRGASYLDSFVNVVFHISALHSVNH
jgi:hypothetical protein